MTPRERRFRAKLAALSRWSAMDTAERKQATEQARAALKAKLGRDGASGFYAGLARKRWEKAERGEEA